MEDKHSKLLINLNELKPGGPGKDGVPDISNPHFVRPQKAQEWLKPVEPVISLVVNGRARAYPLQILIWHEIVNDRIGDVPVIVTFCPLCHSAVVFNRRVQGREYTGGLQQMMHE